MGSLTGVSGIVASVIAPLADCGVSVFCVSTNLDDFVLVSVSNCIPDYLGGGPVMQQAHDSRSSGGRIAVEAGSAKLKNQYLKSDLRALV